MLVVVLQNYSYSLQLQLAPNDIGSLIKQTAELLAAGRGNDK